MGLCSDRCYNSGHDDAGPRSAPRRYAYTARCCCGLCPSLGEWAALFEALRCCCGLCPSLGEWPVLFCAPRRPDASYVPAFDVPVNAVNTAAGPSVCEWAEPPFEC